MAKYIDAERLKETLKDLKVEGNRRSDKAIQMAIDELFPQVIDDEPLEDVEPIEYARWKCLAIGQYECTQCGYEPLERTQYCGNCGAKMVEEKKQ